MPPADEARAAPRQLAVLPLRDTVVFPRTIQPLTFGRDASVKALESLKDGDDVIALFLQRDARVDDPSADELFPIGVVARIMKAPPVEDPAQHIVVVQGIERVRLVDLTQREPFLRAVVEPIAETLAEPNDPEFVATVQSAREIATEIVIASPLLSNELVLVMEKVEDPSRLSDLIASFLPFLPRTTRQELLETTDVCARMRRVNEELIKERENLRIRRRIETEIEQRVGKAQHEFFLREQLKAIQRELGESDDTERQMDEISRAIELADMPERVKAEAVRELKRLAQIPPAAAEYAVARTYLDWLVTLPWARTSAVAADVERAQRVLDEDHFGLEKVKERIVEYLAVLTLTKEIRGPLLCFVGPPGVGKTSLGKSIARATGRAFVRISLGGTRDEAEIRGHRRTYVGALPGQIIQGIRRAGTKDPVFMLDEIDKLGQDFRGDPAAALMEVLDPEQNAQFHDHYLDLPFDLSKVMFITTANVLDAVPAPLRDRMEVIELPGYAEGEKLEIAKRYLVPRQLRENGLEGAGLTFTDDALVSVIREYTREAGVRGLERSIGALCRKHARNVAAAIIDSARVTPDVVHARLGAPRFPMESEVAERTRTPGVAVAVAWTPHGGDVFFVEAVRMTPGHGDLTITGQLGIVMKESVETALSWVRGHGAAWGIADAVFERSDLHVHVPSGAVPKDGPSAGVVMVAALVSLLSDRAVKPYVALSGEITLSGRLLPVGGIKEKALAAKRAGVRELVLPKANEPDVREELPAELREGMDYVFVSTIDEALARVLGTSATRAERPRNGVSLGNWTQLAKEGDDDARSPLHDSERLVGAGADA